MVESPGLWGEPYVALLELRDLSWREGVVGSALLDHMRKGASKAEVRKTAEEAGVRAGGPRVLALQFAAAVGDQWPRPEAGKGRGSPQKPGPESPRLGAKPGSPGRPGPGSPSYSCILLGSDRSERGGGIGLAPAKALAPGGLGGWLKKVNDGDAGLHLVIIGAAMTACPQLADDVRSICRVAEAKEEVKDQALAFAVASYRPGLEVAVAGLCDMYCPAGLSSVVTPVFLQSLVGLAVKNTAGFVEALLDHSTVRAGLKDLDRGEVGRKKNAMADGLTRFCQGREGSAAMGRMFVEAFGGAFTLPRLYNTRVAEAAGNLGGLMAGIRALLVEQLVESWTVLEERKRRIVQDVGWKKEAQAPLGERGPGGRFKVAEQPQAWQAAPPPLAQPWRQQAPHGQGLGPPLPPPQGGRGGGGKTGGRGCGRGGRGAAGAMRDPSLDVLVPNHLELKVSLYNDRAYKEGWVFLCSRSTGKAGGCRKPTCPWIHPQSVEAWAEALRGL